MIPQVTHARPEPERPQVRGRAETLMARGTLAVVRRRPLDDCAMIP